VETIGSKRSYALIWCMPNNDDDDDSYSGLSRTCYGESTPYALQKSSVLRWPQKHDDEDDEEKLILLII